MKESVQGDICPLQGIIRTSETVKETGLSTVLRVKRALHRWFSVDSKKRSKTPITLRSTQSTA